MCKPVNEGGLGIPEFSSRLIAQKCMWIKRMQAGSGIFRQAFLKPGIDWDNASTYATPFPRRTNSCDFVDSCLNSWTDSLRFLPFDHSSLIWPLFQPDTANKVKLKCPNTTVNKALNKQIPGANILEKLTICYQVTKYIKNLESTWQREAHDVRKRRFQRLLSTPWTPANKSIWEEQVGAPTVPSAVI
jgi:hypothetical protein